MMTPVMEQIIAQSSKIGCQETEQHSMHQSRNEEEILVGLPGKSEQAIKVKFGNLGIDHVSRRFSRLPGQPMGDQTTGPVFRSMVQNKPLRNFAAAGSLRNG
jgi:hypothetical protein